MTSKRGTLTEQEIRDAAGKLGVHPAALAAVAEVESGPRGAFDKEGRPTILYERHVFHRLTEGRFDHAILKVDNRTYLLSSPGPGGYGLFSHQYLKLAEAERLDWKAANEACSWGLFQLMGENRIECGFADVNEMRGAMEFGVETHLAAFCGFIRSSAPMLQALKYRNWASFAHDYNGPDYARNKYHLKIQAAFERLSKTTYKEA